MKSIKSSKKLAEQNSSPLVVVVMGVSGCGKSTIAELIAAGIRDKGIKVHGKDGDELHPVANINKMAAGEALSDEDRQPWLEEVAAYARSKSMEYGVCVIACSALKQRYRNTLNTAGQVVYIYLTGSYELIASRMHQRTGHFMPEALLESQFATLEDPRGEPNVLSVNIEPSPDIIAANAINLLQQHQHLNTLPSQ